MTELETLERAKMYIDKLANGVNPLDDSIVPENDIVNNIRLSRCFFYVSDVLRKVIENKGHVGAIPKKNKKDFNIDIDTIQKFKYSDVPIPVSKIAEKINMLVNDEDMKKITHRHITDWLLSLGMLEYNVREDGVKVKRPTVAGNDIGMITEHRIGQNGEYTAVMYNKTAQQFIVDNIDAIIMKMNS